jgi:hypothetical protein
MSFVHRRTTHIRNLKPLDLSLGGLSPRPIARHLNCFQGASADSNSIVPVSQAGAFDVTSTVNPAA